jgi:hypothetical protein
MRLPPVKMTEYLQMMKSLGLNFSENRVIKADGLHQDNFNNELLTNKINIYEKKNYLFGFTFTGLQRNRRKQKVRNNRCCEA